MNEEKNVSLYSSIMIGIGGMIGGGIFSVLGIVINKSKNFSWISIIIAGLVTLASAYPFTKIALKNKNMNSISNYYEKYIKSNYYIRSFNILILVAYIFSLALYTKAFSNYFSVLFNIDEKIALLSGIIMILISYIINLKSIKVVTMIENISVSIKLTILGLVILIITYFLPSSNYISNLSFNYNFNTITIVTSSFLIFIAYEGFELISSVTSKMKEKDVKKTYYLTIFIVMVIYTLITILVTGTLSFEVIKNSSEYVLAQSIKPIMGSFGFKVISLTACISTFSAVNGTLLTLQKNIIFDEEHSEIKKYTFFSFDLTYLFTILMSIILVLIFNLSLISSAASLLFILLFISISYITYKNNLNLQANKYYLIIIMFIQISIGIYITYYNFKHENIVNNIVVIFLILLPFIISKLYKNKS